MELFEEEGEFFGAGPHEGGYGGGAGDGVESAGAFDDDFGEGFLFGDDVLEVVGGIDAEDDVEIGELEVGVEDDGIFSALGEGGGKVGGEAGFADASFSGCDRDGEHVLVSRLFCGYRLGF